MKVIVIFIVYWESEVLMIFLLDNEYEIIYDFGGFFFELYEIKYCVKGFFYIVFILEIKFKNKGILVYYNMMRGLDYGLWIFLYCMYLEVNIFVV